MRVVETCAGIGALGHGALKAGFTICCHNDINPKFCDHLRSIDAPHVVEGDIAKLSTVAQIHAHAPNASTLAFGFSCQPFSKLGDQRHGNDQRAQSLPSALYAAFLLQMDTLVLECVPEASTSVFVQKCMDQYLECTRSTRSETLLELSDLWPAKRKRWWSIIVKDYVGQMRLEPLPKLEMTPTIRCVLPYFLSLSDEELRQLTLTPEERGMFTRFGRGLGTQLVEANMPLATSLHAWGNQCQDCACGCRPAFSEHRLQHMGLYGALIHVGGRTPDTDLRHISPKEMALLNGFAKQDGWEASQRLLMAGIGQLASPVQSSWIFGILRNHLAEGKLTSFCIRPAKEILQDVFTELFELRDSWIQDHPSVPMQVFQHQLKALLQPDKVSMVSIDVGLHEPDDLDKAIAADMDKFDPTSDPVHSDVQTGLQPAERECLHQRVASSSFSDPAPCTDLAIDASAVDISVGMHTDTGPNVAPAVVCPITGALTAFSTEVPPTEVKDEVTMTMLDSALEEESPIKEVSALPDHPVPMDTVDTHETDHVESFSQTIARALIQNVTIVVDRETGTWTPVPCDAQVTVQALMQADHALTGESSHFTTLIGQPIPATDRVQVHAVMVRHAHPHPVTDIIGVIQSQIFGLVRSHALVVQQGCVATDEMMYYLQGIAQTHGVLAVDPLVVHNHEDVAELLQAWKQELRSPVEMIVTAVLAGQHWIPFVIRPQQAEVHTVITTPEGKALWEFFFPLTAEPVSIHEVALPAAQFPFDCGFRSMEWITAVLNGHTPAGLTVQGAEQWRFLFWQHLFTSEVAFATSQVTLGGHGSELETALKALLREHGVFSDRLADRTQHLIQQMGAGPLHKAFQARRPWMAIKDLANAAHPKVKIILEDEFDQVVKSRSRTGQPVRTKKLLSGAGDSKSTAVLSPTDIVVPPGVFAQQDGQVLATLTLRQLGPQVKGIVISTEADVQPYLSQFPISREGLGFLILPPISESLQSQGVAVRFPAQAVATGEPVLLTAALIQGGSKEVGRNVPASRPHVDQVDTQTIKVLIYKDQVTQPWVEVADKPIRYVLQIFPSLKVCKSPNCECPAWHWKSEDAVEPILDVWQRDHLSVHFKRTKATEASLFTCMMRVTATAFQQILQFSGTAGAFLEARTHDGRQQDPMYHTIWLNKMSYEEARAAQTTTEVPTALVRVTNRYGLRVASTAAKDVHEQFRPSDPFMTGTTQETWIVGPMPWGTTRQALQKLFTTWEWQAKPLQPAGRSADQLGLKWQVRAAAPPKSFVFTLSHGDVLIVKDSAPVATGVRVPEVEASQKTQQAIQPGPLAYDPWAKAAFGGNRSTTTSQPVTMDHIASLEAAVVEKVMAKLPASSNKPGASEDAEMIPDHEQRFLQMESQIKQLQTEQQALGGRMDQIGHQIESQTRSMQQTVEKQLSDQMSRLEALFRKRDRTESWLASRFDRTPQGLLAIVQINFAGPFWATSCRIGEAANPGPWSLSAINPTGLAGKASVFDDLATGVHAISETHLTAQGTTRFRQELRGNKSRYQLVAGHPAPYRSANLRSCGGKHTGVGFLSPFPCRQIAHGWQQRLYSTSRLVAAAFWIGSSWIFGGVAYGFAHDAHTREVQQNTDELLQELTTQVVHCGHPLAFVAGDWNQEHGVLLEPLKWEQWGWKDIQTLAAQRWGIRETVTCKHTTRKDFLYLSPGLQDLLISVSNTWDFFADHSCLQAVLHDPSAPPLEARWFRPRIIPYDDATFVAHLANTKVTSPSLPEPMTDRYQAICQQLEAHVDDTLGKLGKPRLVRSQKGRGTTLSRTLHRVACAPVKSSREGEPIPEYVGPNLRYKQWFTQARRLSSYVNLMKTGRRDDLALEQRVRNWNAVLRSSGFAVSFADWWPFRSAKTHDGPLQIPLEPPGHFEAQSIYQEFMREVTHLGQILRHRQQEALKHKYDSNPNAVYRDVTKPSTVPVQVLLAKRHTEVVEICSPEQVRVAPGLTVSPRTTVTAGEATLMVTESHSEQGTLTFAQAHSLEVGDVLIQTAHHGSVPEIHNLFAEEWSKRWDKHRHLPEDHWQEICTYIDLALEGSPMPSQPITLKQLQHTLRSKKARSATGMDGVSKQDLVHAPEHLQESLTQLLNDVEISGNWPEQLLHGAIHSLAKVPNAEEVGQFRPVTVLPMMYRVWSSIRSRQILAHLGTVAPPTMLGNMPHKDAPTFWWQLQLEVENAQLTDMPMAGVTTDLIKAFNGLPREPIFHAARKLGIPECILRAWKAAAAGIQRHFYVRDQPGPALTSVTGFVEGCGMSVCAMAIYCLVLHSYAANKVPRAVMYSYVDNLEFLSGDPDAACEALEAIAAMTEWMGVPIDRRKTFAWGTTAPLRRTLEDQVPLVMLSAKDLGGHLQFSGKQTNFSVKSKCQDLQWLWRKLAQSRAPLTQKLKVLTTVAWPRAFHSASIVHLSDAILTDLRRDAVKALGISKSGLNPQVFLSLQGNALCDPGFFILWDALSKFRRFATASLVEAMLSQVAWTPSRIKRPGPIGVLTSRLSQIGWAWSHETQFRDHTGECIDIMHCPIQELRYRVKRSWHHMVGHLVMERKGYAGIQTVDAWTSVMTVPDLSPEENGLLRTLQAGTFMTNDHLQPAGLVDSKSCKFCGQDDSMEHRHWHCQETQSLRDMLPPDVLQSCTLALHVPGKEVGSASRWPLTCLLMEHVWTPSCPLQDWQHGPWLWEGRGHGKPAASCH